ncbi:MAG: hypothetical protein RIQ89_2277 [Bacteroidota bacterium]|jgi:uncharacterized membrane protein
MGDNKRPKIKLEWSKVDYFIEWLGWLMLMGLWLLVLINHPSLPEIIPTHFNFSGHIDGYGSKQLIFNMPVLATVLFVGMTWLNKFPHLFNYPVKITTENAHSQYKIGTRLIRWLKLMVVVVMIASVYSILAKAKY